MTSSYQTLARYADERPGNRMPDIRHQMRQDLLNSRNRTKRAQLLEIRRLSERLTDYEDILYDHGEGYYEPDFQSNSYDQSDVLLSSWDHLVSWSNTPESSPSNTPSPCLSHNSDLSSTNSSVTPNQCDSLRNSKPFLSRSRSTLSRREILRMRKRVQNSSHNPEMVSIEYNTLKRYIIEQSHNPKIVGFILCSRWNVIADAVNALDEELSKDAIRFITSLIHHRLVEISDILFILQQGFMLVIKDSISRLGSQQVEVLTFLSRLIYYEPRAASYIIELVVDTETTKVLEDFLEFGTEIEASSAIKFYKSLIDIEMSLYRCGNYNPVVPDTLSRTVPQSQLIKTYCPLVALKRIIRPNFIATLINRFFKPVVVTAGLNLFDIANDMLATALSLAYLHTISEKKDLAWVFSILQEFELSKFYQQLQRIVLNQESHRLNIKSLDLLRIVSGIYSKVHVTFAKTQTLLVGHCE